MYVCDFDGTVALEDVGSRFFRTFTTDPAAWRKIIDAWYAGTMGGREVLARECALVDVDEPRLDAFVRGHGLDPAFAPFVAAAHAAGDEVTIASDGLLLYIRRLLDAHGLARVPARANDARFIAGRLVPTFGTPPGEGCGACGTCKGAVLEALAPAHARIVFVGDGLSARCAAPRADVVYAQGDLMVFCLTAGIAARPFDTFADVARGEGLALTELR